MNKEYIEVWTLNLLETYKDDSLKITDYYKDYLKLANEYNGLRNEHSCLAIENALNQYLKFIKTNGEIVAISEKSVNFLFYRGSFGFLFCKKINKITYNQVTLYGLEVIYPGIKDMLIAYTNNQTKVKMVK